MKADLLIINSSEILTLKTKNGFKIGRDIDDLGIIKNGGVAIKNGLIIEAGKTRDIFRKFKKVKKIIDAENKAVMPGFVDPHTHLVFAGSRAREYEAKILGKSYADLHKGLGRQKSGIFYTVEMTRKAAKKELLEKALKDLKMMVQGGTTTLEAKSGYGLDAENEIKILEVIKDLNRRQPIEIAATFLGAHTVPEEYKNNRKGYVALLKKLLGEIKNKNLAEFCDVFCDKLGFNVEESREILETAKTLGYKVKLHAEQTGYTGGAKLGAELKAVSCDHLDYITGEEIKLLAKNKIAAVLLPTVTFHLMEMSANPSKNYDISKLFWPAQVRKMIENKVIVALATDYNPGSSPCFSMKTVIECAARLYRMRPAEIISAVTINAAYAIAKQDSVGSLEKGKKADLLILDCADWRELINTFGTNLIKCAIKNGKVEYEKKV